MWRVLQKRASRRATIRPDYWSFPRDTKAKLKSNDLYLTKRHQNGPMICVWIHGHQLSIKFFNVPVHISQLEFIFEANFCVYTEIVCLWKFLKRTFKIFLTVFSSYKHHRAIYVVAYFRCQNGIYNCNKSVNTNCLLMKIFETDFRDFVYFSSYKQQSAWNMAAYFHCQKRRQNGPMICVWTHDIGRTTWPQSGFFTCQCISLS